MDTSHFGRAIIAIGLFIVLFGGLVWVVGRLGLPLGRLPGDIAIQRGDFSAYFPCATSIVVSIVLTILLNLAVRLLRR